MRYLDSTFGNLLKPIDRRWFAAVVDRHDGDAYDKHFKSWDHLVTLIFAQLGHVDSLRGLETAFNANAHQHYHLGAGEIARSTLSDAGARRPTQIFAETFAMLSATADRQTRSEGAAMVELIDASPIPLGKLCKWSKWNGRIRGMKLHVVYDPQADRPGGPPQREGGEIGDEAEGVGLAESAAVGDVLVQAEGGNRHSGCGWPSRDRRAVGWDGTSSVPARFNL